MRRRSGSRVSTRERTFSGGSTPSNIGGSLTRVNSVTSVLRRLFSKEDRPDGNKTDGTRTPARMMNSSSAASLQARAIGNLVLNNKYKEKRKEKLEKCGFRDFKL